MCVVSGLIACKNKVRCERAVAMFVARLEANLCLVKLSNLLVEIGYWGMFVCQKICLISLA